MTLPKLISAWLLAMACLAVTAQPRDSVEGIHYQALQAPVSTETPDDVIEVRELFWYGCPECAGFSPLMNDWRDGVTGDLAFRRTPVIWNETMALHARIFYTAQVLGQEDRIHLAAFRATSEQGKALRTVGAIREFFSGHGIDTGAFDQAWNSPQVTEALAQAKELTDTYAPEKIPAVVVNGLYIVTMNQAVNDHIELNIAVNLLVRRLRDERRADF